MFGDRRYTAGLATTMAIGLGVGIAGATPAAADPISDLSAAAIETLRELGAPIAGQTSLPFPGVRWQRGIAVDRGDVYVIDSASKNVLKLGTEDSRPVTLPFGELVDPRAVAVEDGNVYVADTGTSQILELAAGESTPRALPFTGLKQPMGVAVEHGNVYVADSYNMRVVQLAAGESTQTELLSFDSSGPRAIAVDNGNVYITDFHALEVVKFAAGTSEPTVLPFRPDRSIMSIAAENGDVYVSESVNRPFRPGSVSGPAPTDVGVRKITDGTSPATVVPFRNFDFGGGVAVSEGKVYINDGPNERVLMLPADAVAPRIGDMFGS
ncbi:hypothetical protein [Rhodococcus sp. NPDC049939]|uniref:hypothetical protein n=1 Tax=Rhodococcus sp. NPDC049939 TaxID=3155511 RepID=UPI0033CC61DF